MRAGFIQQVLSFFGQPLARHNALFVQKRVIQFYYLGICATITSICIDRIQNIGCTAHMNNIVVYNAVFQ